MIQIISFPGAVNDSYRVKNGADSLAGQMTNVTISFHEKIAIVGRCDRQALQGNYYNTWMLISNN
jgi:hypothetical protein